MIAEVVAKSSVCGPGLSGPPVVVEPAHNRTHIHMVIGGWLCGMDGHGWMVMDGGSWVMEDGHGWMVMDHGGWGHGS